MKGKWVLALLTAAASSVQASGSSPWLAGVEEIVSEIKPRSLYFGDSKAGTLGGVRTDGDALTFTDGTPFRGWGVGVRITDTFPPTRKSELDELVDLIAAFGFNHIRIYGFDFSSPGIYAQWQKTGRMPIDHMDRICDFVSSAKSRGIYYSVSVNHNPMRFAKPGKGKNRRLWNNWKFRQLIDEDALVETVRWVNALFSYRQGKCDLNFARDPANVYFDAVNEASVFAEFDRDFRSLEPSTIDLLNEKFRIWLRARYGTNDRFRASWGSASPIAGVRIKGRGAMKAASAAEKVDTVSFLVSLDSHYAETIRETVRRLGYEGLFSVTNHWYGDGALIVADQIGDVVEMHVYFDHPKVKGKGGKDGPRMLLDRSYVNEIDDSEVRNWGYHRSPLHLLFESSISGKPLIVTEWNHGAWSRFGYEGPVLLMAYSALQGYQIVDLHTLQESTSAYGKGLNRSSFSFLGNPVLMALQPSLSLAYRNGYISTFERVSPSVNGLLDIDRELQEIAVAGNRFVPKPAELRSSFGFKRWHRRPGFSAKRDTPPKGVPPKGVGDVDEPSVSRRDGLFAVRSDRFFAAVGDRRAEPATAPIASIELDVSSAVTVVPLDGRKLANSKRLLVTVVAGYTRADRAESVEDGLDGSRKVVTNPGMQPAQLVTYTGALRLRRGKGGQTPKVAVLDFDGSRRPLEALSLGEGRDEFEFAIAGNAPWYLIMY